MEGPKKIYLFPGIASGYESRTFPDEIKYIRADLTDALVEAAEKAIHLVELGLASDRACYWCDERGTCKESPDSETCPVLLRLESAPAAYRGEVNE